MSLSIKSQSPQKREEKRQDMLSNLLQNPDINFELIAKQNILQAKQQQQKQSQQIPHLKDKNGNPIYIKSEYIAEIPLNIGNQQFISTNVFELQGELACIRLEDQYNEQDLMPSYHQYLRDKKNKGNLQNCKREMKMWTPDEDELLHELVEKYDSNWQLIVNEFPGRTTAQCSQRYRRLNPVKKRAMWTEQEDIQLFNMVQECKRNGVQANWQEISKQMLSGRTGQQIRQRYVNNLDPSINKAAWSVDEDKLIVEMYKKYGPKWSDLSKIIPGRPENMIKNRFNSYIKKVYDADNGFKLRPEYEKFVEEAHHLSSQDGNANNLLHLQQEGPYKRVNQTHLYFSMQSNTNSGGNTANMSPQRLLSNQKSISSTDYHQQSTINISNFPEFNHNHNQDHSQVKFSAFHKIQNDANASTDCNNNNGMFAEDNQFQNLNQTSYNQNVSQQPRFMQYMTKDERIASPEQANLNLNQYSIISQSDQEMKEEDIVSDNDESQEFQPKVDCHASFIQPHHLNAQVMPSNLNQYGQPQPQPQTTFMQPIDQKAQMQMYNTSLYNLNQENQYSYGANGGDISQFNRNDQRNLIIQNNIQPQAQNLNSYYIAAMQFPQQQQLQGGGQQLQQNDFQNYQTLQFQQQQFQQEQEQVQIKDPGFFLNKQQ